jgi:drug/metabolite transporter (DMT)-like permease
LLSEALALVTSITNALGIVLVAKGMKRVSSPSVAAFYSVLVQAATLTAISVTRLSMLNWLALTYFAVGGVLSLGLARLLYFVATRSIGVARASAIIGSNPVLTAILSIVLLAEVPLISLFIGATSVAIGVLLISGAKNFRLEKAFIIGLFSALSYSMSYIVSKMGLMIEADPVLSAEVGTLAGLLFIYSYIVVTREHGSLRIDRFSLSCFAATGFVSTLGWVSLMKAFEIGVVSVVTTIVYSYPLFTLFLSRSFLRDEKLSMRTVAGSVLVVVGVAVVALLRLV